MDVLSAHRGCFLFLKAKASKADLPLNKEMDKNGRRRERGVRGAVFYVAMGQLCLASFEFCPDPWSPWVGRGHTRGLGEVLLSASLFFPLSLFSKPVLLSLSKCLSLLEGFHMATLTFGYYEMLRSCGSRETNFSITLITPQRTVSNLGLE